MAQDNKKKMSQENKTMSPKLARLSDKLEDYAYEHLSDNMPDMEKDITEHFMLNKKHIQTTIEKIINRHLSRIECDRLREHSMELALIQVNDKYKKESAVNK